MNCTITLLFSLHLVYNSRALPITSPLILIGTYRALKPTSITTSKFYLSLILVAANSRSHRPTHHTVCDQEYKGHHLAMSMGGINSDIEQLHIDEDVRMFDRMDTEHGSAPKEAEERHQKLWRIVQTVLSAFNTQPYNGEYKGRPRTQLLLSRDFEDPEYFRNTERLAFVIRDDLPDISSTLLEPLIKLKGGTLRFHCTGSIRRSDHDQCALTLINDLINSLRVKRCALKVDNLVVSWDHRSQIEKNTEAMQSLGLAHEAAALTPSGTIYQPSSASGSFSYLFYPKPNLSHPLIRCAKTDGGLRGIVRLEHCHNRLTEVLYLIKVLQLNWAVQADKRRAELAGQCYHVDDPYELNVGYDKVEYDEVEAD